jgi:hypothetical protein
MSTITIMIEVIPKKENYTEAAKYLSNIMDIFEQNASFDS